MNFFNELKRRNVFKVAAAYVIVGWLIMQVGDTLGPALLLPGWINSALAFFLILGFPLAMFFAWAFEMTEDGIKKEKDIDRDSSITPVTSQKLNNMIIGLLVLALGYFAFDKFVVAPGRNSVEIDTALLTAQEAAPESAPVENEKSIAVLPFVNMSSDAEQEYFSDGLSEELLNLLAKIPELQVAARTSSFSFKGQNIEIPVIAERLGVAHVLEGSVRKSGNQVRITAQLIRADNGFHLWSETFDRELDNIFQIQDEIALAVVDALKITLLGDAPKAKKINAKAYSLFLEGQFFRQQINLESLQKAITLLKSALEIEPDYAPAWAELGFSYIWLAGIGGMSIEEGSALTEEAVELAIRADPEYGWAYFTRGASRVFQKFDFKAGVEDYRRALQLNPGNAYLIAANGTGDRVMGRLDGSVRHYQAALERDPLMVEIQLFLGITYEALGRLEDAESIYRKGLSINPQMAGAQARLARLLIEKGNLSEALAVANQESSIVYRLTSQAMAHHALGDSEKSQSALDELINDHAMHAAFQVAEVYGFRGEADKTFEWLEHSYSIHDSGLSSILADTAFRGLTTDPRWETFLEKLGLAEAWRAMPPEWGGPQS
ncbi:MAG: adenylate cyclase [Lysobacterales bacterium]